MTILRRASDILTANLNEWIDRCENPERMLRQLVRELEEAADAAMEATAKAIAHERLLERELSARQQQGERLQERARAAVVRGDEAAARAAVAARVRQQRLVDACVAQHELANREAARLRQQLDVIRSRLSEARQTLHLYTARQRLAESRRTLVRNSPCRAQAAWGRFDRLCERIDRADAESVALLELLDEPDFEEEQPFEELIDLELEALKATVAESAADE